MQYKHIFKDELGRKQERVYQTLDDAIKAHKERGGDVYEFRMHHILWEVA